MTDIKIKAGEGRDKLIVMPLQPAQGQEAGGTGLGIHFLLGNLFCLHKGFLECWFGWRVKNIFPDAKELTAYCRGNSPYNDIRGLGNREKVRFWLEGTYALVPEGVTTDMVLHDTRDDLFVRESFFLNFDDELFGFRDRFFDWLDNCGPGFDGRDTGVWPEQIDLQGLDYLGRALEALYLSYVDAGVKSIDMEYYDRAVEQCPDSYLVQDLHGWGLYKNEVYGRAEAAFLKARELNPDGMGAIAGLMWCAVLDKDREKALEYALEKGRCRGEDPEKAKAFVDKKLA
jgi:tetratricopeptide (TPR) repeat protein